jgi:hypothetical protein
VGIYGNMDGDKYFPMERIGDRDGEYFEERGSFLHSIPAPLISLSMHYFFNTSLIKSNNFYLYQLYF